MSNSIQNYQPSYLSNVGSSSQVSGGTVSSVSTDSATAAADGFEPTGAQTQFLSSQAPLPAEGQVSGTGDSGAAVGEALLELLTGSGSTGSTAGGTSETHHHHAHGGHHRSGGSSDAGGSDASALELLEQLAGTGTGSTSASGTDGGSALALLEQLAGGGASGVSDGSSSLGLGLGGGTGDSPSLGLGLGGASDTGSGVISGTGDDSQLAGLGGGSDSIVGTESDDGSTDPLQQLESGSTAGGVSASSASTAATPLQAILQGGAGVLTSEPQPQFDLRKVQQR